MRMEPARQMRAGGFCASEPRELGDIDQLIAALRAHIARIERAEGRLDAPKTRGLPWVSGVEDLDRHLPAVAFFLLFWLWLGLAWLKRDYCTTHLLQCF